MGVMSPRHTVDNNLIGGEISTTSPLNPLMSLCKLGETLNLGPVCRCIPTHLAGAV